MRLRTAAIFIVPALILLMAGCGPPPPADDASLSGLAISSGTLTPAFSPAVTDYTVDVPYSITGVTVTPTTADDGATVTVEGVPVISGNPSATIDLNAGEAEAIAIVVTAADGTTTRTYTIVATRSGCRFSADADTVALWHFDELSGQTVYDASTNGLDLVFGDSDAVEPAKDPTWVSSGRDGFGGAISVDGTETAGQYARSGLVSGYISTNYSVEFWIKITDATTWGTVIVLSSEIVIYIDAVTKMPILGMPDDGGYWHFCTSSVGISDGEWHYVACTYDGAAVRIYIDGVETGSLAIDTTVNPTIFYIGGHYNQSSVDAQLDEVRISDVARSADAIANYYYGATN